MNTLIIVLAGTLVLAIVWRLVQAKRSAPASSSSAPSSSSASSIRATAVTASEAGVRELLARGERIAAIKLMMEIRGMDLKSAHDAVGELADNGTLPNAAPRPAPTTIASDPELRQYLAVGEVINAIKRYRDLTGCSLKQAKDAVDQLM